MEGAVAGDHGAAGGRGIVGWAMRSEPTIYLHQWSENVVGTAQARLCPPYEFLAMAA
ncbi:hypothetical protein ACVWVY_001903 [Bradyrhizobium sp. URHC0002]